MELTALFIKVRNKSALITTVKKERKKHSKYTDIYCSCVAALGGHAVSSIGSARGGNH